MGLVLCELFELAVLDKLLTLGGLNGDCHHHHHRGGPAPSP